MSELLRDQVFDLQEENRELTERLRVACETIEQLKRANKEWEQLWKPIDDLVRPYVGLGESVADEALYIIKNGLEGTL